MDKEDLQNRIIAINEELMATRTNVLKLEGHLAEAHHWLATLFKAEIGEIPPLPLEPVEQCKEQDDGEVDSEEQSEAA